MWIGNWLGSLNGGGGGPVTSQELQDLLDDVVSAQALVDQAQDDLAAAEEADDDAVNAAQDALIAANEQLAQANAALAAANQASAANAAAAAAAAAASAASANTAAQTNATDIQALQLVSHDPVPQDNRLDAIEAVLGTPAEVFDITLPEAGNLTNVFDWNTTGYNDIQARDFYVQTDPDSATPLTQLTVPNGQTVRFYVVGPLFNNNAGSFSNIGGAAVDVTNSGGNLSYTLIDQNFEPVASANWPSTTYNQLTDSNANVGEFRQASGDFLFEAGQGQGFVDLSQIHDGAEQDARLDALESSGTGLDTRLAAVEAQLPDDDTALAQQVADNAALILAEAADQDTAEAQIQTLITQAAANTTAANNAATAASNNAANLAQEIADRTAGDQNLQSQIDALPGPYNDAPVTARLDALELVSHDPQPQDDAHADLVGLVGGSSLPPSAPDTFTVLTADPGNTDNLFIRPAVTNAGYRREHFHVSEDPNQIQNITSVVVPEGTTKDLYIVQGVYNIGLDQLSGKQKIIVRLLNTAGTLSYSFLSRQVTGSGIDWETSTFNSFTGTNTNDLDFDTGSFEWLFDGAVVAGGETILQRIAVIESQLPDDDTGLAQSIADNAAAIAAEIAATDADVALLLGQTAANLTATQTNAAAAASNASDIAQEIADRQGADTALDARVAALEALDPVLTSGAQTINGAKTFNSAILLSNSGSVDAAGLGTGIYPSTGNNSLIVYPGSTEVGESAYVRTLTVAGNSPNTLTTKSYVDAQDSALDVRLAAVEAQLPDDDTALAQQVADNAALIMSEAADQDTAEAQIQTLIAQAAANTTAANNAASAASTNAANLAQEIADRTAADNALQSDINTKDAQNVKITGAQTITGVKTFQNNPIIESSTAVPAVIDIVSKDTNNTQGLYIYDDAVANGTAVAELIRNKSADILRLAKETTALTLRATFADLTVPLVITNTGNNTTEGGRLEIREALDNGNSSVRIGAPDALASTYELVLPDGPPPVNATLKVASIAAGVAVLEWDAPFLAVIRGVPGDQLNDTTAWDPVNAIAPTFEKDPTGNAVSAAAGEITVVEAGTYRVYGMVRGTSNSQRLAIELSHSINGTVPADAPISSTGYIRAVSGHNASSNHLETLVDLAAGDTLQLVGRRESTAGTWTGTHYEFTVEKLYS